VFAGCVRGSGIIRFYRQDYPNQKKRSGAEICSLEQKSAPGSKNKCSREQLGRALLQNTVLKSFFMPMGKSAHLCSCQAFLPVLYLAGSFFALLTTDRLYHSGNGNAFLFLQQMNMEMEMCFRFIIL
jgi:hypothetical protein